MAYNPYSIKRLRVWTDEHLVFAHRDLVQILNSMSCRPLRYLDEIMPIRGQIEGMYEAVCVEARGRNLCLCGERNCPSMDAGTCTTLSQPSSG